MAASPAPSVDLGDDVTELGIISEEDVMDGALEPTELDLDQEPISQGAYPSEHDRLEAEDVMVAAESSSDSEEDAPSGSGVIMASSVVPSLSSPRAALAEAVVDTSAPRKKPAGASWPSLRCLGMANHTCTFHAAGTGRPARVHPDRGETRCLMCDPIKCRAAADQTLTALLSKFKAVSSDLHHGAEERLRQHLGDAKVNSLLDPWAGCLAHRRLVGAPLNSKAQDEYTARMKRDRRVARRKIFFPASCRRGPQRTTRQMRSRRCRCLALWMTWPRTTLASRLRVERCLASWRPGASKGHGAFAKPATASVPDLFSQ